MIDRAKFLQLGIYTVIDEIKNQILTLTYAGYRFPNNYILVEHLLRLCEEVIFLRARPETQKLLDAFHKIENKYKPKGLGKGVKSLF